MTIPQGPNQRWSLNFVADAFSNGRHFRILTVVDDFTREGLALVPDTSLSSARVARELDGLLARRGKPLMIISDNGTEFTSMAMLRWSQDHQVDALHRGGQAHTERFRRELQRQAARRVSQRDAVLIAGPGPACPGQLA